MNFFAAGVSYFSFLPPIATEADISDVDLSGGWEPFFARDILQHADAHGRAELDWVVRLRSRLAAIEREGAPQKKKKRGMLGRLIRHFDKRQAKR
jgi:hypothetical protein